LPDVFVGRFSVDQAIELQTVVNKCVNYERSPFEPNGDWRKRMLITEFAARRIFQTYNSAWPTLEWIGRQFLERANYTTFTQCRIRGNASQSTSGLIRGEFRGYRGYGSPSDWAYPNYNLSHVNG